MQLFVRSVSSCPGMKNALRIGLVPQQTTSSTHLSTALPFFPDASDYFPSYDVFQLMLTDATYVSSFVNVLQLLVSFELLNVFYNFAS